MGSRGPPYASAKLADDEENALEDDINLSRASSLLLDPRLKGQISFLELWRFASPRECYILGIASVLSFVTGFINPSAVAIFGQIMIDFTLAFERPNDPREPNQLGSKALLFLLLGAVMLATTYASRALWELTAEAQAKKVGLAYLECILKKDLEWFDVNPGESIVARLGTDIPRMRQGIGENTGRIIRILSVVICCLIQAIVASWKVTGIIFALSPLILAIGLSITKLESWALKRTSKASIDALKVAEQAIAGIRTTHAFSLRDRFAKSYEDKLRILSRAEGWKSFTDGFGLGVFNGIVFLIFAFGFWFAGKLVNSGELQGGKAVTAVLCMMILATSVLDLPEALTALAAAQSSATILYREIHRRPGKKVQAVTSRHDARAINGAISIRNLYFSYPARPHVSVLNGLSVEIRAGDTFAFVGSSGSGKSTIVSLLQKFYNPIAGDIFVDGIDISRLDTATLRKNIGLVGQEPTLFALTIKQNILMGLPDGAEISQSEFLRICQMAQVDSFVSEFPQGYDTFIGPGTLSGGQKQRVAIARALIKNPRILLLDEATSALDSKSERLVQVALEAAYAGRTCIVVAHRLSTIRRATSICVMKNGQIIEQGSHDELISRNGAYTQLVNRQRLSSGDLDQSNRQPAPPHYKTPPARVSPVEPGQGQVLRLETPDVLVEQVKARLLQERTASQQGLGTKRRNEWLRVRAMTSGMKFRFFLGTLAAAGFGATFPAFSILLGFLIFAVMADGETTAWVIGIAAVGLFSFVTKWAQVSLFGNADAKVVLRLRSLVFRNLVKQEIGFFDSKSNTAGILSRKLANIEAVPRVVTETWSTFFQLFVCALMGLTQAANQSGPITRMVLLYAPVVIGASVWQTWSYSRFAEQSKVAIEQSTQVAAEAVREVKTLQTLQREDFSVKRFEAFLAEPYRLNRQNAVRDSLAHGLQSTSAMWTLAISLGYGQKLINDGSSRIEHVISAVICLLATMIAIASAAGAAKSYSKGLFAARTALALLDRQSEIDHDKPGYIPASFDPRFQFRNLWFQYPTANAPTFRGEFNLEGWAGQSLAIVGPSGSGKSTVIGLLQRWYDANGGEALVGGLAIRDYALSKGLRANIALVGQEPVLFDMSIADNIAWGSELPVTMDQIVEAAKQADVHDFVTALPDGYNTRAGDKGGHLSGGQKQRIAIARALIRQPKMLLLDEATSALDSTSEAAVQRAIDRAARGRTTITIAHRLSTVKNVDRIVVINDGRVVETGKHEELLQLNGTYTDMCSQQNL
ncbi:hypothetical protein HDU87_007164 [Geranomyces variabilis]|uniref:Uncharacterized protein n=1 Tax=Geranomyces variabilis TaxID=109894 RepID=A0AAD5TJT4_9FUNG|nr:hypothetical protein HDU87_007164 [Geranomyces variabilis]